MILVKLDFETRSRVNLKKAGVEKYSRDPSTEIICLVYYARGGFHVWLPGDHDDLLKAAAATPEFTFVAHNAGFEEAIWRNIMVPCYGFPELPMDRWDCTMAACAVRGYPLKLGDAAHRSGVQWKDMRASKETIALSRVVGTNDKGKTKVMTYDKTPLFPAYSGWGFVPLSDAIVTDVVLPYCKQDVVVEDQVLNRVGILRGLGKERDVWLLDQRMNHRGVMLDIPFVLAASKVVERAAGPLLQRFQTLTGLSKLGSPKLKDWCVEHGTKIENLQKATIEKLIKTADEENNDDYGIFEDSLAGNDTDGTDDDWCGLLPDVREALQLKALLGGAAVKKLPAMLACVCGDSRAYGVTQYYAAHTGRWGGRLFQPQNFPRQSAGDDPEAVVAAIMSGDPVVVERELRLPALVAVARALRHAIVAPPGKRLVVGDYKSIEAVIVLALAGYHEDARALAGGEPIYMRMAEQIHNKAPGTWAVADPVLYKHYKEIEHVQEYTIGKNTILGCGFQMGYDKFHARYCPEQPIEFAKRGVDGYRARYKNVVDMWYRLQDAGLAAAKGIPSDSHGLHYERDNGWLRADLPNSWQHIWYPDPQLGTGKFGKECWQYQKGNHGGGFVDMYGGLQTENYVQALARGIMVGALARLDAAGWNPILTCHDEIMCEVDEDKVDMVEFDRLMTLPDRSSTGIPIALESWNGPRYKK